MQEKISQMVTKGLQPPERIIKHQRKGKQGAVKITFICPVKYINKKNLEYVSPASYVAVFYY